MAVPLGQYFSCNNIQVHVRNYPDTSRRPRGEDDMEGEWQADSVKVILPKRFYTEADLRRFMGSQLRRKKFKENLKCQNATFPKDVVRYHWGVNKAK